MNDSDAKTDAVEHELHDTIARKCRDEDCVEADFARQFERENAQRAEAFRLMVGKWE